MRIISNFNDYYDIGVAYGVDPNIVYDRKEEEVDEQTIKQLFNIPAHERINFRDVINKLFKQDLYRPFMGFPPNIHLIGFCGKWHFGFLINKIDFHRQLVPHMEWCWSDRLDNDIEKEDRNTRQFKGTIKELLKKDPEENMEPFIKLNAPIIHIKSSRYGVRLSKNPCLKKFNFASVIDPWTAFQEIDMFVSGIMGQPQPNTDDISDENLRDAKGFDTMSFKKPKQKKHTKV